MATPVLPPPPNAGASLFRWLALLWTSASRVQLAVDGPTITQGEGAPTAPQPNGSIYLRTDGAAATTLYVRAAGAWVAK